jgi:hypothetical protein
VDDKITQPFEFQNPGFLNDTYNAGHYMKIQLTDMYDGGYMEVNRGLELVQHNWSAAMDTWNNLLLSWGGEASDASDQLRARIDALQLKLFGKPVEGHPDQANPVGILDYIQGLILSAENAFDDAESSIKDSFDRITTSLTGAAPPPLWFDVDKDGKGDLPMPGGKQASDHTVGPVTEVYSHPIDRGHTDGTLVGPPSENHEPYKSPWQIQQDQLHDIGEEKKHNPSEWGSKGP